MTSRSSSPPVTFEPSGREVHPDPAGDDLPVGRPGCLLRLGLRAELAIAHACGGYGRCTSCRVEVLEGAALLEAPGEGEAGALARAGLALPAGRAPGWRLSCQATLGADAPPPASGLRVRVPEAPATSPELVMDGLGPGPRRDG